MTELASIYRTDYFAFAKRAIRDVDGTVVSRDKYLEFLSGKLTDFANGDIKRLIINMPPRSLKTLFGTVSLTAWILGHQPEAKIIILACTRDLSERMSRPARNIMMSDRYKRTFPTRLAKRQAINFTTTAGGEVYATSFDSNITGYGADFILIDDPHKIPDAGDPESLAATIATFDTEVESRLNNPNDGGILLMGHRIHDEADLSAHLIETGEYELVALPLVAPRDQIYTTPYGQWRRRQGELLRRGTYHPDKIERMRVQSVNPSFELLYQQDIDALSPSSISAKHFRWYTADRIENFPRIISVDPGSGESRRASFSVVQVWAFDGVNFYLSYQFRAQCKLHELVSIVKQVAQRNYRVPILIEATAHGPGLISELERKGFKTIHRITPEGSKRARFRPHIEKIIAGRIHLPMKGDFCSDFVDEMVRFPHGPTDDQVDAFSQCATWAMEQDFSQLKRPHQDSPSYIAFAGNSQSSAPSLSNQAFDPKARGIAVGSGNSNPFFKRWV